MSKNSYNVSNASSNGNGKNPYFGNTLSVSARVVGGDDDGLSPHPNGIHMMREIPSDAAFQTNVDALGPGGCNDTNESGWDNKTHFILSIVGYSVGLGNIWVCAPFIYSILKTPGLMFIRQEQYKKFM